MTREEFLDLMGPVITLAGTQVPAHWIPGEPMTADEVIAAMITNGHTQDYAEDVIRFVHRGWWRPNEHPHTDSANCHTVKWHRFAGGHYTYIGR